MPSSQIALPLRRFGIIIVVLASILTVYLFSLCPDVYTIDSGELATVSYTLGIAHPTGYPLYTLISYFFAHIPGEPIRNLNALSALFSAAAAAFLFLISRHVTRNAYASVLIVSLFAFSPIIWRMSVTNEVYPLTVLFSAILIFLLFRLESDRIYYLLLYVAGLSLTNHMMVFSLVLPLFLYALFIHRPGLHKTIIGLLFLFLGLSLYMYLMTRTMGNAKYAWGNTENLQRLLWHMTGKQYQIWMFSSSPAEVLTNLAGAAKFLLRNLLYILIIPSVYGFYVLYRKDRAKLWLLLTILVLNILYTINYSIPDIEAYFIPSFIVLLVSLAYAMVNFSKYLRLFVILPIALAIPFLNYRSCTLRDNYFAVDLARANMSSLPDSSLFITTYWDIYSPIMYLREIKKERTDIVVIDKELLRRTWYLKYLEREYPDFFRSTRQDIEAYLIELMKFEYDRPYLPHVIQSRFLNMIESFVDAKTQEGVYIASSPQDMDLNAIKPQYRRLPYGLAIRITPDSTIDPFDFNRFLLKRPPVVNDPRQEYNMQIVRGMLIANINYLVRTGRAAKAAKVQAILNSL
ncbi:MAG: DUF2723 domain-containing protein [candidate division WOR-3 bacterium]|nr:MAG: DUF2723 domain-containing protein [candidate division WOR-3 bacterium]